MENKKYIFPIFMLFLSIICSCDTVENSSTNSISEEDGKKDLPDWLVPSDEVFDGGPGKDGIPALTDPSFINVSEVNYLDNDDLVLVVREGEEIRVYPHPILDWHEIINDKIGDKSFALTYCPLTGSGISWDRIIDGEETTFGVSGLLYNTNLIPYDRKTQSNWSQMGLQSINGELISDKVKTYPIIETSWETAKILFPNSLVVSSNTGYSRNYGRYPYGNYKTNHSLFIFPVNNSDSRLKSKERVLGVFGNNTNKAYRILDFEESKLFVDVIDGDDYLVYGDNKNNLIAVFDIARFVPDITFKKSSLPLPYIIEDNLGNQYDIFGKSKDVSFPSLKPAKSFIAYWFAWAAFYPDTELYNN